MLLSCSTSKTFVLKVDDKDIEFNDLTFLVMDCSNYSKEIKKYQENIEVLNKEKRATLNNIYSTYGFESKQSSDAVLKHTLPINLAIKENERNINQLKNNCLKFYYSLASDGNCYVFIDIGNNNNKQHYKSINRLSLLNKNGYQLIFEPLSSPNIVDYNSESSILHLVKRKISKEEIAYLKKQNFIRIQVLYNNSIEISLD